MKCFSGGFDYLCINNQLIGSLNMVGFFGCCFFSQIMVGSSIGGWLMLLAAIARPEKTAALVGISTAADHIVTSFNSLPIEVGTKCYHLASHFWRFI